MDNIYNQPEVVKNLSKFIKKIPELIPNRKVNNNCYREKNSESIVSDVHAESNDVFPQCFAGLKLLASRDLGQVGIFQKYNYASEQSYTKASNEDVNTLLHMATNADSHTASVTFKYDLPKKFQVKSNIEVRQMKTALYDCNLNYATGNMLWSLTVASQNVNIDKLRIASKLYENITPEFSCGCEVTLKANLSSPLDRFSISGRFKKNSYTFATTISNKGCEISLRKRLTPCVEVAAICKDRHISAAFRHDLANGGSFKAFFDSNNNAGFTMRMDVKLGVKEKEEYPVLRFVGSSMMNGNKKTYLGFGVFAYL